MSLQMLIPWDRKRDRKGTSTRRVWSARAFGAFGPMFEYDSGWLQFYDDKSAGLMYDYARACHEEKKYFQKQ